MRPMTPTERETFLAEPHIGTMSVATGDERPPLTVPLFYGYQPGGELSFFTSSKGQRARKTGLIERFERVSLSVQTAPPPRYVTVECSLTDIARPPTIDQMLAVVGRYMPPEQAEGFARAEIDFPGSQLVVYTFRIDRWLSADFTE